MNTKGTLLTFKPNDAPLVVPVVKDEYSEFVTLLDNDVWFGQTPDLPRLRYEESIPVFIWDELKTYKPYNKIGLHDKDMKTMSYLAKSRDTYLPFVNTASERATKQSMLLPTNKDWVMHVKTLGSFGQPKTLGGRIINVSLRGLQILDTYYNNTSVHTRRKAQFYTTHGGTLVNAWVYTVPTTSFLKYKPHEQEYTLVKGFTPHVCPTVGDTYSSTHVEHRGSTFERHSSTPTV